jgi:MoxR-like ATPase
VVSLVRATRATPELLLWASPRAALHLLRASRAVALIHGRDHVLPDDVQELVVPVLAHRLLPAGAMTGHDRGTTNILTRLVSQVPVPGASYRP